MTNDDIFLAEVRDQLRRMRLLSDATCAAFETLTASTRAAYAHAMAFAGCTDARVPDGLDIDVTADDRVKAAELMLLKLSVDTGSPVWSSYLMERMQDEILDVPGGKIDDLFRALAAVLHDYDVPLTDTVANFLKDLVVLAFIRHRNSYNTSDLAWLVHDLLTRPTPAVAYFGLLALPDEHVPAAREAIVAALNNSRFAGEAASSLNDVPD